LAGAIITVNSISTAEKPRGGATPLLEYVSVMSFTALVTGAAFVLEHLTGYRTIALLYLLLVVALGIKFRRGPVLLAAASSAVAWDFFFIPTRFSLHIATIEDLLMFIMFFVVAMAMGHLTSQLRSSEIAERRRQERSTALYELVQQSGLAPDLETGLRAAISLTETLFDVRVSLLLRLPDHSLSTVSHAASTYALEGNEHAISSWAFHHSVPAGKFTDTFPEALALHLPLKGRSAVMGVLSIQPSPEIVFDGAERELLETFALLIGTVLEKEELIQDSKRAEVLATSERLERALLQSVSHELKTPLSVVGTGIEALAKMFPPDDRSETTVREIQRALRRLHRIINNLLNMTRIESGAVRPQLDWCDVGEIVEAARDLAADALAAHKVEIEIDRSLPIVWVDQPLLEQCISNLLLNAASNSAAGSAIRIAANVYRDCLVISVRDEGTGILESDLPHIFETFYRGAEGRPGGAGLGLAIVDGFTRVLGGSVTAANRQPDGAEFVITIPVRTLNPETMEKFA
jgi:two-component system, OmpR family, sensor histidine kinase KdpD